MALPFEPVALDPGEERIIGLEFRTAGDLTDACEHYSDGTAVEWTFVPVAWQWLVGEHVQEIDLPEPIAFMAPTEPTARRGSLGGCLVLSRMVGVT